jgi:hypothetical protein
MSDEEIMNLDAESFGTPASEEEKAPGDTEAEDKSVSSESDEDNPGEDADGAASDDDPSDDKADGTDTTSTEEGDNADEQDPTSAQSEESPEDDQSSEQDPSDDAESELDDDKVNFEAEYNKLMAPFRAAKREVTLDNIEDARRLMQMGVDYSQKLQRMKPHLRILRTLEKAGLTDPSRINFLIDLENKNPEAIKKLLKDNDIDPLTLNLEGSEDYTPTDHQIGEAELAVRDVLDNIKDSPKFQETVDVISKQMDQASRTQLQESPEVIAEIHSHIETGIYQKVMDGVANERMYGRLTGLSDLQAYYQVGDAMYKAGKFEDSTGAPSTPTSDKQGSAQDSGSGTSKAKADKVNLRNRKRAASPTKGKAASSGKAAPDFSKMSDEDIEKLDPSSF